MTQQDPLVGKVLADRFEILSRIGEGGIGVVYKARQITGCVLPVEAGVTAGDPVNHLAEIMEVRAAALAIPAVS